MSERKAHDIHDRERTEDIHIDENVDFESMYLSEYVLAGLKTSGFIRPSPIQLAAIPLGRCGLDMVVQAKSGTGKTCVFTVVALEMISVSAPTTQVLVLTPTREIAVQVTQVICSIGSKMPGLKASTFIGGLHLSLDKAKLQCCHIAVGTPGRITQLIEMGLLRLENIRLLVLDEADQLLSGQFADGIAQIASALPLNKQIIALSATYTEDVAKVAEGLMRSPNHVRLGKDSPALLGVDQFVKMLPFHRQIHRRQQTKFLELINILSKVTFNQCLVFSNSQLRAESVCNKLRASGWPVSFLSGGQAQKDRLIALDALCSYKCRVLVSTDLSARGLDSEHVNLVINLDIPRDHATYLHRIGRAGRFGSRGSAISLATEGDEWYVMRAIVSLANVQVRLLKDEVTANVAKRDAEHQEYVEFMTEDEFTQYLKTEAYEYSDNKKDKTKKYSNTHHKEKNGTKSMMMNGYELAAQTKKTTSDACNGQLSDNSENEECGKRSVFHNGKQKVKGSPSRSERYLAGETKQKRKLEKEKKNQEELAREKAQNEHIVQDFLKRINPKTTLSSVSFNDILAEMTELSTKVSIDDNPSVQIPSLLGTLAISEVEGKALAAHCKSVEDNLNEVVCVTEDDWKNSRYSLEQVLQARIEGKDAAKCFETVGETKQDDQQHAEKPSTCNSELPAVEASDTPSYSNSERRSKSGRSNDKTSPLREESSCRALSSKYKQYAEDATNSLRKTRRKKKNARSGTDIKISEVSRHYCKDNIKSDTSETSDQESYSTDEQDCYECHRDMYYDWYVHDKHCDDTWHHGWCAQEMQFNDTQHEFVYQNAAADYKDFVKYSIGIQQKYLDSIEKFTAMMDYVHTMGKTSSWIARDYHMGFK